jgi:hypothetical protein
MESSSKCPIRPYNGYSVLRLDEDDNTYKATLLSINNEWIITESRVLYDQAHVVYDFHTFNDGDRVNYVLIRDEGLLAGIGDEKSFILGDK